jgi:hypothetical protein
VSLVRTNKPLLTPHPAFLLAPTTWAKVALLGVLDLFNAGWYSILKAQLHSMMPGQSGTVMAVGNVFGPVGGADPTGAGAGRRTVRPGGDDVAADDGASRSPDWHTKNKDYIVATDPSIGT